MLKWLKIIVNVGKGVYAFIDECRVEHRVNKEIVARIQSKRHEKVLH